MIRWMTVVVVVMEEWKGERGSMTKKFYIADTFSKYLSVFHGLKITITECLDI